MRRKSNGGRLTQTGAIDSNAVRNSTREVRLKRDSSQMAVIFD